MYIKKIPQIIQFVTIAFVFVIIGNLFILQQFKQGTGYYAIGGDSIEYIKMIEGKEASPSFDNRIIIPIIASLIPIPAEQALKLITNFSLVILYVSILYLLKYFNLDLKSSAIGLMGIFSTSTHQYLYYNPYLLDATALMLLTTLLYAYFKNNFMVFGLVSLLSPFIKETIAFLAPLWTLKNFKRGITLLLLLILLLFIFKTDENVFHLPSVMDIILSWGILWVIGIYGLRKEVIPAFVLLSIFSLITFFFATDTRRMLAVLTPVFTISIAQFFNKTKSLWLIIIFLIQTITATKNVFFDESSFIFTSDWPRIVILSMATIIVLSLLIKIESEK